MVGSIMKVYHAILLSFASGVLITSAVVSTLPKPHTDSFRQVYVLPKACQTVIQVDQDVKANVRDDIVLGGTNKLIQGEDEWFNEKLKECRSYESL